MVAWEAKTCLYSAYCCFKAWSCNYLAPARRVLVLRKRAHFIASLWVSDWHTDPDWVWFAYRACCLSCCNCDCDYGGSCRNRSWCLISYASQSGALEASLWKQLASAAFKMWWSKVRSSGWCSLTGRVKDPHSFDWRGKNREQRFVAHVGQRSLVDSFSLSYRATMTHLSYRW